jgi:multisubunit Na+/H+ antiporter MnhB subunit
MAPHPLMDAKIIATGDVESRQALVRRFARVVSLAMIVLCNTIVFVGLRASGINLDELVTTPDVFDSKHDICLRLAWQPVAGTAAPIRVCSEWINLSDPSGKTHQLQREIKFREGPDGGQYYVDQGEHADYRLLILVLVVVAVIAFGLILQWYLVSRYRLRLESAVGHGTSLVH